MKTFNNPILPGFYPDPSICRVLDDYYLVTSTFSYFPGVPIFHSKDLVHWKQIGNVLDRPSQLNLEGVGHSEGIFAPVIRYHKGVFYMITTNVTHGGTFIVTASNPEGPWSEPYWLTNADGIDPSLFFDEDDRAWYTGTHPAPEGTKYDGNWEVWLQELDLETMQLKGEQYSLWRGALKDAIWPEGPHIYKIKGTYYLLIAEAGTGHNHAVTIAKSDAVTGPYIGNPGNPILTHRHLGVDYPIVNVGHSDLIETQNGEWWMVLLASRPYGGYYRNLGRETFLVPVTWENEWPVISKGTGKIEDTYPVPNLPITPFEMENACDHFESQNLHHKWISLRTPKQPFWSLSQRPGYLRLSLSPITLAEKEHPSFLCIRQRHKTFYALTALEFTPKAEGEAAGLAMIQNNQYYFTFTLTQKDDKNVIQLKRVESGQEEIMIERSIEHHQRTYLKIEAREQALSFYYGTDVQCMQLLMKDIDGRILSTDIAGGFVGTCLGIYGSSEGHSSQNYADFDWFEYSGN